MEFIMFPRKRTKSHPALDVKTQKLLWSNVVFQAISHNDYDVDLKIKVITSLQDGRDDLLLNIADELVSVVHETRQKHYLMHQLAALIRKFAHLDLASDPRVACRNTLRSTEWRAKWTNRKIRAARKRPSNIDSLVHYARQYVIRILSTREEYDETGFRSPEPDVPDIMRRCTLTGGAVVGVHGNATNVLRKLDAPWSCTPDCYPYALAAVASNSQLCEMLLSNDRGYICWDHDEFSSKFADKIVFVDANKGDSVAKTAKTDRGIAVEPWLNLFVQTGINAVLREKLAKHGLDLSTQRWNQEIALAASGEDDPNGYCTIDLSNASDSLATEVVRELLPPEWFEILNRTRSRFTRFQGEEGYAATERFCSMGNGFCFPLQTLIYASIIYASSRECEVSDPLDFIVYGDDLIVRKAIFERVLLNLKRLGFSPNGKKTYSDGPFRESCGVDGYSGADIRPIFCEGFPTITEIYNLYNQSIRRTYATEYFESIRTFLRGWVRKHRREYDLVCPYDPTVKLDVNGRVDGAFWVPFDVAMSHRNARYHPETWSWSFMLLYPEPKGDSFDHSTYSLLAEQVGMLWTALVGGSSSTPFVLRYSNTYRKKRYWGPAGWLPDAVI
jgi:hypothetical protein